MQALSPRRRPERARALLAAALLLLVMAGCGRKPAPPGKPPHETTDRQAAVAPAPSTPPPRRDPAGAIAVAEANLKQDGTIPAGARFRGVTAWAQAMGGRVAVCGQTDPFASDPGLFVPFVSVIEKTKPVPVDRFVGKTTDDADRVYEAITGYCFEQGGPIPALTASPLPIPPLPNGASPVDASAASPVAPASASSTPPAIVAPNPSKPSGASNPPDASGAPASGSVTMRQDGNLHEAPHGLTVRVLPAGTVLHVFAVAPGGWLQVGDTAPEGWVHDSMVGR